MARSGKNTSQQVISQALCLSGPICFHPHGTFPWGPHGFPCVLNQGTCSGTPNASRWEQQLERLAGKISFLVAVAWGNVNIPTGKAKRKNGSLEGSDSFITRTGVKWSGEERSSSFHEDLGCAETLKINPLWNHLCICLFPKLHSPAFKPVWKKSPF